MNGTPLEEQPTGSAFMMRGHVPSGHGPTGLEAPRRAGVPFGIAWPQVLESVRDEAWREALCQTAGSWRRAFDLEPPQASDAAIDLLSRGFANELADLDAADHCPVCDDVVVQRQRKGMPRVYCSRACQRIANGRRELLDAAA
jgi:hypothetical protein